MVKSDVAVAQMAGRPTPKRKSGTINVPPPIPSSPEKIPTITPHKAATINDST